MAITRISNNQITDSQSGNTFLGIDGSTKLQDNSITSGKIANNLTYGSDLTVSGNLTVQGTSTTLDSINVIVEDPLLLLAKEQTGTPALDIGFIGQRGTDTNIAFVWNEANDEFAAVFTSTSESNTTITISSYADMKIAALGATSMSASGNVTGGNLLTAGYVDASGNIDGGNFNTAGLVEATGNVTGGNLITAGTMEATGNASAANFNTAGAMSATGNVTGGNIISLGSFTANSLESTTSITAGTFISAAGNVTGGNLITAGAIEGDSVTASSTVDATGNITGGNILSDGIVDATTDVTAGGAVSAVGNVTGGNLITAGDVDAATGTIATLDGTTATFTGNVSGGNVLTGGLVSATGNVTGGNIITSGDVDASTGTIATLDGTTATFTGNVTGGNLITAGALEANSIDSTTSITAGTTIDATGNITGGNLLTGGALEATGDASAANFNTAGAMSATGNVTGGNIITGGAVEATGNASAANFNTAGEVSATGNVTGGNVLTNTLVGSGVTITSTGDLNLSASGNIAVGDNNITGVATPVQDGDAANKSYVDGVAQGLDVKDSVHLATDSALASYTYANGASGVGATLTADASGALTVDGVATEAGDRILVKDESGANAPYNGIYVVTTVGDGSTAWVLTRTTDFDAGDEIPSAFTFVEEGSVNADAGFVCTTNEPVTVGTTDIDWTQFSGAGSLSAGDGIDITGTTISTKYDGNIAINGSNQLSIATNANIIDPILNDATATTLSASGNVTGGNFITAGDIDASTGTIATLDGTTATFTGNVQGGNLVSDADVTTVTVTASGAISTNTTVDATGNITGGNLITAGDIDASTGSIATLDGTTADFTGNVTGGNLITAGDVDASTGTIATLDGTTATFTGNVTGGNLITAGALEANSIDSTTSITAGTTIDATGNITGGNLITAGDVDAATGTITTLDGTLATYTTGNMTTVNATTVNTTDVVATGDVDALTGTIATLDGTTATFTGNVSGGNVLSDAQVSAAGNVTGANFITAGDVDAATGTIATLDGTTATFTGNVSGGNISATSQADLGNIVISGDDITGTNGRVNFNTAAGDVDFAVNGSTTANLLYVDAGADSVSFGSETQTAGSTVAFNFADSMLMPVGTTAQRPGTPSEGMLRYNSSISALEFYDSAQWQTAGTDFTTIVANSQNGDGSTVAFTIPQESTTSGTIVTLNGVTQTPTTAYSVSGTTVTFTEAPATTDVIDFRILTTSKTVSALNGAGGGAIIGDASLEQFNITGDLVPSANVSYDLGTASLAWNDLYLSGSTIYLGGLQLQASGDTFVVYQSDGVTQANIDAGSIDVSAISSGTSSIGLSGVNGPMTVAVNGTSNVLVVNTTTSTLSSALSATGNITADTFFGDGSQLTGIDATSIQNGTTSVATAASGNVTVTVGGATKGVFHGSGLNVTGDTVMTGNLDVQGTVTTIDSTTVHINDLAINVANNASTSTQANGGGIKVGPDGSEYASLTWDNTNSRWNMDVPLNVTGEMNATTISIGGTDVTASAAELNYVDGVTSAIQTQLNGKQATITGAATTIDTENLTASRALVSDGSGKVGVSAVTSTELGYLDGVTSSIQTQLDGKLTAGATSGSGISGSASSGTFTVTSNATSANTANTIVFRDASGDFSAGTISATATNAQYADLAENYEADAHIEPGTVVMFGGDKEVTACVDANCKRVAGVVSTDPAYLMNSMAEGEHIVPVAFTGRVPCKVTGPVRKGDLMVSAGNGHAMANNDPAVGSIIGKALENFDGDEGVIEVVVGRF